MLFSKNSVNLSYFSVEYFLIESSDSFIIWFAVDILLFGVVFVINPCKLSFKYIVSSMMNLFSEGFSKVNIFFFIGSDRCVFIKVIKIMIREVNLC